MTVLEPCASPAPAPPRFLWLEVTGRCQLHCTHCYAESGPDGDHGTMTPPDWERVIDQAAAAGVRGVQFIGGEPTLHPALPRLVAHAALRGLDVDVYTNLVHVTDELWTVFERCGVRLATSYYCDDPDAHARIVRRPTHARTKATIAEAVRRGVPLRVGIVDLGEGQRVAGARAELIALGVPAAAIGYDRVRAFGRAARGRPPSPGELCGGCGDGAAAVGPDGGVTPCVFARSTTVGNVRTDPLTAALTGLPAARETLLRHGMPGGDRGRCDPGICHPRGDECWPSNCHPRW